MIHGDYEIRHGQNGGFLILLRGVIVATQLGGSYASARTLIGQADFREESERWLRDLRDLREHA